MLDLCIHAYVCMYALLLFFFRTITKHIVLHQYVLLTEVKQSKLKLTGIKGTMLHRSASIVLSHLEHRFG